MALGFSVEDAILDALERIGGEGTEASEVVSARRSLRLILEEWAAMGLNTWRIKRHDVALPSSPEGSILQPSVDDIIDVTIRDSETATSETPIDRYSRSDYAALSDKSQEGRPNVWYLERTEPARLFLWPLGSEEQVARIWYMERPSGPESLNWNFDAPTRWMPALVHGLAYDLSQKRIGVPEEVIGRLRQSYGERLDLCRRNDRDRVSFRVKLGGRYR